MRVASLFSGIGGIELGIAQARADVELCLLCEIEPHARRVLQAHFPDAPLHDDVRTLEALPAGVELVCAGSPCTDFSSAGNAKRAPRGLEGDASSLLTEVFRLLDTAPSVRHVVLENVDQMRTLDGGAGLEYALEQLERRDFGWAYRMLDARAFGLRQRRQRLVIVGRRQAPPPLWLLATSAAPPTEHRELATADFAAFSYIEGTRGSGFAVGETPTLRTNSNVAVLPLPLPEPPTLACVRRLHVEDAEALQGFPHGWTETLASRYQRTQRLGNAVPVPMFAWVGAHLDDESPPPPPLTSPSYDSQSPLWRRAAVHPAAWGDGRGARRAIAVGAYPVVLPCHRLRNLRCGSPLPLRAVRGFLRRARRGAPGVPPWFLQVLTRLDVHHSPTSDTSSGVRTNTDEIGGVESSGGDDIVCVANGNRIALLGCGRDGARAAQASARPAATAALRVE